MSLGLEFIILHYSYDYIIFISQLNELVQIKTSFGSCISDYQNIQNLPKDHSLLSGPRIHECDSGQREQSYFSSRHRQRLYQQLLFFLLTGT